MAKRPHAASIDDYIAQFPAATQKVLRQMRRVIRAAAKGTTETISYAIPTFDLDGRHLVFFAGYERHVGFYPGGGKIGELKDELAQYKQGKGSVQFPLDRPLPVALIRRMVEFRVAQERARATAGATAPARVTRTPAARKTKKR